MEPRGHLEAGVVCNARFFVVNIQQDMSHVRERERIDVLVTKNHLGCLILEIRLESEVGSFCTEFAGNQLTYLVCPNLQFFDFLTF